MSKRAAVDVTGELLADAVRVLDDAGFRVVGSLQSKDDGVARLIIEGHGLPSECESEERAVHIAFTSEHYGKQKLVKVSEISLVL